MSHSMLGALRRQRPEHSPGFEFHLGYTARPFSEKELSKAFFKQYQWTVTLWECWHFCINTVGIKSSTKKKKLFFFWKADVRSKNSSMVGKLCNTELRPQPHKRHLLAIKGQGVTSQWEIYQLTIFIYDQGSHAEWGGCMVPAPREAKAGGQFEPRTSLGNTARPLI